MGKSGNDNPVTLYIVHLDDESQWRNAFKKGFPRIRRALSAFFKREYSSENSDRASGRIPLHLEFRLLQYQSVEDFVAELDPKKNKSGAWQSLLMLVLDYYIVPPGRPRSERRTVHKYQHGNMEFKDWLRATFPHVPVALLTVGGQLEITDVPPEWEYFNKGTLRNEENFARRLGQLYSKWWEPSFSNALLSYARTDAADSWHTPGHNAGDAFCRSEFQKAFYAAFGSLSFQTDLSVSVDQLGDLSEPERDAPLAVSQRRSAEIFGSLQTCYITNGTSSSNKAMLMTLLRPGEVVLLDRNCHKSVHQAIVMSGAIPQYLEPAFNKRLGVWTPIQMDVLENKIAAEYPEEAKKFKPRMLILTTCTYEGILYPIHRLSNLCKKHGILFFADEAWAPYLRFHPDYMAEHETGDRYRYNAIDGGAHFVAHSTHKALAAFSQASMIHISSEVKTLLEEDESKEWNWLRKRFSFDGRGSYRRFRHELLEVLRYWHSTSPHYPMLATLDRAGLQMRLEGTRLLAERMKWVRDFRYAVNGFTESGCILGLEDLVGESRLPLYKEYIQDPLKLLVGVRNDRSGTELKKALLKEHIQWEKASTGCVQFLVTIGTFYDHIQHLQRVLYDHRSLLGRPGRLSDADFDLKLATGKLRILPRTAVYGEGKLIRLKDSVGEVSAQMLVPYPPGIPVLLPGLEINKNTVDWVENVIKDKGWHEVHGIHERDGEFYIKVVDPEYTVSKDAPDECLRQFNEFHERS